VRLAKSVPIDSESCRQLVIPLSTRSDEQSSAWCESSLDACLTFWAARKRRGQLTNEAGSKDIVVDSLC